MAHSISIDNLGPLITETTLDPIELEPCPWHGPIHKTPTRPVARDRFLGCLLGGAVGDALGAPVEFLRRGEILRRFGPKGLTGYAPVHGSLGRITDDTQMTLFTAEAIIRIQVASKLQEHPGVLPIIARAYLRWLRTQGEYPDKKLETGVYENGWLIQEQKLHSRREPGGTCLSALKSMKKIGEYPNNDSKGCGAVMRVAPVGLFFWHFVNCEHILNPIFEFALYSAKLTHMHPTGFLTAGVLAVMVTALTDGATVQEALAASQVCLKRKADHEETLWALEQAIELAESSLSPPEAIARLGEGWVAEEALAIAVYCALKAKNFPEGVLMAPRRTSVPLT